MKGKEKLIINDERIVYADPSSASIGQGSMVMMRWEDEIMRLSSKWVTYNQGDILEFGFGMGLSAGHIQSYKPKSHTIIEIHPEIAKKAEEWAKDKPGVKIINADWWDIKDDLEMYDGIFFDTFNDPHEPDWFKVAQSKAKPNCHISFYNNRPYRGNAYGIEVIDYIHKKVMPPKNDYYWFNKYYVPLVIHNP